MTRQAVVGQRPRGGEFRPRGAGLANAPSFWDVTLARGEPRGCASLVQTPAETIAARIGTWQTCAPIEAIGGMWKDLWLLKRMGP